jgi:hypothetical protein
LSEEVAVKLMTPVEVEFVVGMVIDIVGTVVSGIVAVVKVPSVPFDRLPYVSIETGR